MDIWENFGLTGWIGERRNLNGEKNEAAAEHPSHIVAAVDVLGYSPGSTHIVKLETQKNYRLFSRNSSGRRTVNGSFSSFTSNTTMAQS